MEGDGTHGYKQNAPYDGIMVTAACKEIPSPLLKQLKEDGKLIIPVEAFPCQKLKSITKKKDGFIEKNLCNVVFVPLISGQPGINV